MNDFEDGTLAGFPAGVFFLVGREAEMGVRCGGLDAEVVGRCVEVPNFKFRANENDRAIYWRSLYIKECVLIS